MGVVKCGYVFREASVLRQEKEVCQREWRRLRSALGRCKFWVGRKWTGEVAYNGVPYCQPASSISWVGKSVSASFWLRRWSLESGTATM